MQTDKDYYKILGVSEDVDTDTLKKTYRKLSKECHPDLHPDDPTAKDKFADISEAYSVLSDKAKREEYDNMRKFGAADMDDDLFSSFMNMHGFGGMRNNRSATAPQDGSDIAVNCVINFVEFVNGVKKELNTDVHHKCIHCNGTGSKSGKKSECPHCHGNGHIREIVNTIMGRSMNISTCPYCRGTGKAVSDPCPHCHDGFTTDNVKFNISIPKGKHGLLKTSIQGNDGINGGRPGDVYVKVFVRNDSPFEIDDDLNLTTDIYINPFEAMLGGEKEVLTPYGMAKVKIPQGTQYGQKLRIKEKGIYNIQNGRNSDLFLRVIIEIPKNLSKQEIKNIENLKPANTSSHYPKTEEVKNIFTRYKKELDKFNEK